MKPIPDTDAQSLQEVIQSLVSGIGRGGLSYVAARIGMSPSAFKKRLSSECAFDAPTARAILLIAELRGSDLPAKTTKRVGKYLISTHETSEGITPSWTPR